MDELDRDGAFTDCRRHTLDRAELYIAGGENAEPAGLEQERGRSRSQLGASPAERPVRL
ncbi:MAG TPA: hypothetical protein VJO52_15870 [Gemmatimonadaceae bacterium]|nr:hypothetical protein [Gemmatimonadaceae bacterium]